jgi:hypothetical protein
METHRIQVYTDMLVQMQDILDQSRSERAWWPPARCRAMLADVRKVLVTGHRRFDEKPVPYRWAMGRTR